MPEFIDINFFPSVITSRRAIVEEGRLLRLVVTMGDIVERDTGATNQKTCLDGIIVIKRGVVQADLMKGLTRKEEWGNVDGTQLRVRSIFRLSQP